MALLQGPAHAATPTEIAELSEDAARALFRRYRFAENGGDPCCNHCGSPAAWTYQDGKLFKCKQCLRQFTLTTNTPFAYRKLPFKTILLILAQFNVAYQGRSALEIKRDLRAKVKNYKTIFVWLHKIRCAMQAFERRTILREEIEIDGKELKGYIRPKNVRNEKDHWRFPYGAPDRTLRVTLARQRGGPARAWVAKQEHHPIPPFIDVVDPNAVVFADGGHWGQIREHCALKRVIHDHHFYTPEACTNWAESGFRVLEGMRMIYRRILGNYLDLYTAQLTWRLSHTATGPDDSFAALLGTMMTPGRSPMAGYFLKKKAGGSKRRCEIISQDGAPIEWSPPSSEERRLAHKEAKRAAGEVETPRVADARSAKRWRDGFEFMSAGEFMDDPKRMPLSPGVYGLFLRSGERLFNLAGYFPDPQLPAWDHGVSRNGYVGEGYSLRERVTGHLLGSIADSPFRQSVFAIHWVAGTGELGDLKGRQASETALSEWLRSEVVIGYKVCGYHKTVEKEMLKRTAAPLNIRDRDPSSFSRLLSSLRQRFREAVVAAWEPPPPSSRPRQRR